jgi:aryl-alcohol dehydrogenase-like predicted oxidoreductase
VRRIGASDLEVFPVALGSNTFGWTADEETSFAILDAYVEGGGNFIDTADSYAAWVEGNVGGESESVIGAWLARRGARDDIIIATKAGRHPARQGLSTSNIESAAADSMRRLGIDHIDLYYAHGPDETVPVEESLGAFQDLVDRGMVRWTAVSNFSPDQLAAWSAAAATFAGVTPVALQPHYNLVHRSEFETQLEEQVAALGMSVVPYFALASGFLTGKYRSHEDMRDVPRERFVARYFSEEALEVVDALEAVAEAHEVEMATVALAWLLTRPTVAAPIASASRPGQVRALLDAAELRLTQDEVDRLSEASTVAAG